MTIPNWLKVTAPLLAIAALLWLGGGWYKEIGRNAVLAASMASTQHALDSLAKVAIVVDTEYVHDTVRLTHATTVYVTARDTLLLHLTDTIKVKEFVQASDSVVKACSMLQESCEARHTVDSATAAGWQRMYQAEKATKPSAVLTIGKLAVAALAGFGAGRIGH